MWKIILALLLICPSAWATQWRNGMGEQSILGTSNAALIGYNSYNSIVQPLDNLLSNHCNEYLQYASSSTLTVHSGTCVVSNSGGTVRLFMMDTANTTITSANLDTGSITASTTYYVYATAATTSTTTSTYYISASNIAPSGQTYYYQIGSFATNSSSNFYNIVNNNWNSYVQPPVNKSSGVTYQALTDGQFTAVGYNVTNSTGAIQAYTDSTSSPSTPCAEVHTAYGVVSCLVQKGNYYVVSISGAASLGYYYFVPLGK